MFRKISESLETATVQARLKSGNLACPECGAEARHLPKKSDDVIECSACGLKASLAEWAADDSHGPMHGRADQPPVVTKIRREGHVHGVVTWHIPPTGKFGFLLFFGTFWLGGAMLVSSGFLYTYLTGGEIKGNAPDWVLIPFFGIFYAIGLGVLYAGLCQKFMLYTLAVSGREVRLDKELFGWKKEKSLARETVKSVENTVFYTQNDDPVYGIEITGTGGKIKFGSGLKDDEKSWLVADIRQSLFGKREIKNALSPATGLPKPMGARVAEHATVRQEAFSAPIPQYGKGGLVAALVFGMIGVAFIAIGIFVIGGEKLPVATAEKGLLYHFDLVFSLLGNGFQFIWLAISSLFAILGIGMTVSILRGYGSERRLEGNSTEISIRTYKRGQIIKNQSFPRNQVTDIRTSASGSANGKTMKRIELIVGTKAEKIATWVNGDEADAFAEKVRSAIG